MAENVHTTPAAAEGVTRVTTTAHLGRRTIAGSGLLALLGSSATLAKRAGAAPFTPAPNPDAALLALGAALDVAEAKQTAWDRDNPDGSDEEFDAVTAPCRDLVHQIEHMEAHTIAQAALAERLCELRLTTLDGARALARALAFYDAELFRNAAPGGYTNEMLLGALVGGLIGWPDEAGAT